MDLDRATLRWLNDSVGNGILTTDAGLVVRGWNQWLELHSGRPAADVLGRNLLELYPELVERRLDAFYAQALAGQAVVLSQRFHRYLLRLPAQRNRAGFVEMQQTAAIAPLYEGDQIIGAITTIEDVTERVLREEEFGRQLAIQDALHEIDRAILTLDLPECLRRVVNKTAGLIGAPVAAVVLCERDGPRVAACTYASGDCPPAAQALAEGTIAAWAAESRQAILLADVNAARPGAAALRPLAPGSRSVIAAPLIIENQVIGALVVESPRPDAFSETEQSLVIALATQTAVGIHNARLYTAVAESEERYRDLIEHSRDLICTHDLEGRILTVNPAVAKSVGYEADELLQKNLRDFLVPEARGRFAAYLETIRRDGAARGLLQMLTRTGERRVWEYDNTLRTEGVAVPIVRGMAHDVTERLRAEKRSRAFSQLGHRLSTAATVEEAAGTIMDVADELLGWDACSFDLYSEETGTTAPVLNMDIVAGRRAAVPPAYPGASLTPTTRRLLTEGGQLILRDATGALANDLMPFGDTNRPSASLMFVAIRSRQRVVGILSIQSYTPYFYDQESLAVLQALADHCGGALERIQAEAAEHGQRVLAEALRDTAAALSGTLDFDQILDRILAEVGRVVPHDTVNIMLITGGQARITREHGSAEHGLPPPSLDLRLDVHETSTLHEMAATGRPYIVSDTQTYEGWVHSNENRWIRSYAGAPIRSRGQTLGFLNLNSHTPGFFTSAHTERLRAFADQAAMALENARLLAEAQRHARELAVLYETAIATTGTLETDALLAEMSRQVCRLIAVDSLFVALYNPEAEECRLVFAISDDEAVQDQMVGMRLPLAGEGLIAWVARTGQTLHIGDVQGDQLPAPLIQVGPKTKRAWLGVPLMAHNRLIGVISIQSNRPHAFSDENRRLLEALAAPIAIAIENARLYEEVRSHAAELEQRVAVRTTELRDANEKLRELDRFKSQFVSNVSHELRTPLTNIKLVLGLLDRGKSDKRPYYMATLQRETDLLNALIEDLLYLSRMDLGRVQPNLEILDVNALAATLTGDRTALFADRGLMLRLETRPDLPFVRADPRMLTQVLANLMTNAMNYTPAGGMVTVSTGWQMADAGPNPQSQITNPRWVTLSVSDTGPGISAEEQARLFERFYRGDAARQSGAPGTGLGLSICQGIIQRHDGQITVESVVGQGTTFTAWLPAAEDKAD
ncbi:MAG: GAF domain-containing protein [Chloroflexi bacterium]|nr:GAF domain-containing protein [Chloroflexota bacterium]